MRLYIAPKWLMQVVIAVTILALFLVGVKMSYRINALKVTQSNHEQIIKHAFDLNKEDGKKTKIKELLTI